MTVLLEQELNKMQHAINRMIGKHEWTAYQETIDRLKLSSEAKTIWDNILQLETGNVNCFDTNFFRPDGLVARLQVEEARLCLERTK
jgi:hypothetical protein